MKNLTYSLALLGLAATPAYADILLEDGFDYALGSAQNTWNAGTGFKNNWSVGAGTTATIVSGLSFGSMPTRGNAIQVSYTNTSGGYAAGALNRTMDLGTINSGDIWMSYLYQYNTSSTGPTDQVALELRPTAGQIRNGVAEKSNEGFYTHYGTGKTNSSANSVFKDGTTLLMIFYYPELDADASRTARGWALTLNDYEQVVLAGLTVESLNQYATLIVDHSFDAPVSINGNGAFQMVPSARNNGTQASFIIDELKMGTNLGDVLTAIPEPSIIALLAGASGIFAVAVARYRARSKVGAVN